MVAGGLTCRVALGAAGGSRPALELAGLCDVRRTLPACARPAQHRRPLRSCSASATAQRSRCC
eukprot:1149198-Pyramimonas_sp.AAC.1